MKNKAQTRLKLNKKFARSNNKLGLCIFWLNACLKKVFFFFKKAQNV